MVGSKPKLFLLYSRGKKLKADAEQTGWFVLTKQPSNASQLKLALLHKGEEEEEWEEVAKELWKKNTNLTIIAFSGAYPRECGLQKINDQTVLSLGKTLLLDNLMEILDYCRTDSRSGITVKALYDALCKVPWRYEYFLELALRLLSFNAESMFVVKAIVGIDENGEMIEGEYQKRTILNPSENELFLRVKFALFQLLEAQDKSVSGAAADSESFDLYGTIQKLLYELALPQRKLMRD